MRILQAESAECGLACIAMVASDYGQAHSLPALRQQFPISLLFVPSRAVGFIEPGDKVLLRYQAYPYQKFGHHDGVVARISHSALSAGEMNALVGNSQVGEPYYRVLVDIRQQSIIAYGKSESLRPGMLVDADILGEHRKLYEWVLEPLYSLTGRL